MTRDHDDTTPIRLDPWDDATAIAARLHQPGSELTVVLGAEAWCSKCQRLRSLFDTVSAAQASAKDVWLWLDLEDDAELLGSFVPDDLPLLLRWRAGACVQAAMLIGIDNGAELRLRLQDQPVPEDMPDLWAGFARGDWASI